MFKENAVVFLEPKGASLEVIRAAKERGYITIALISDAQFLQKTATAYVGLLKNIDFKFEVHSWSDKNSWRAIWQILRKKYNVSGVFTGMEACVEASAEMLESLSHPVTSPAVWRNVINKYQCRKLLREAGLSNIKSFLSDEILTKSKWPFSGEAYFKPIKGVLSLYVKRCSSLKEVVDAAKLLTDGYPNDGIYLRDFISSGNDFHVEEAVEGELLSVESIIENGSFRSLGLLSRIMFSEDSTVEMGSCFPYPRPDEERIVNLVRNAHKALGITHGATHTEVIVGVDGKIEIIDLNPRFVGADVMRSISLAYGVEISETLLDLAIGKPVTVPSQAKQFSCLQYVIPPSGIKFQSMTFPVSSDIAFVNSFIPPGTILSQIHRQSDYAGCYLVTGSNYNQAIKTSFELRDQVLINENLKGRF